MSPQSNLSQYRHWVRFQSLSFSHPLGMYSTVYWLEPAWVMQSHQLPVWFCPSLVWDLNYIHLLPGLWLISLEGTMLSKRLLKDPLFSVFLLSMHSYTFYSILWEVTLKVDKMHTLREQGRQFFLVEAVLSTILQSKPSFKWTSDEQKDLDLLNSLLSVWLSFVQQAIYVQTLPWKVSKPFKPSWVKTLKMPLVVIYIIQ